MLAVVFLGAFLWFGTGIMGLARGVRGSLVGLLFAAVISVHLVFPDNHPLRLATGETAAPWLLLLGFVALFFVYRKGLSALRGRVENGGAVALEPARKPGAFSDTELDRYARHIVLREVGGAGQKALKDAKVLVVGAGGLGAPALQYLAAAGVGTIGVIDDDTVENANLQRQVIHRDDTIGMPKVFSAQAAMQAQNPFVEVRPYHRRLTPDIAPELVAEYDLVLDGTDNFETRYLVNDVCVAGAVPLVSGALSQWEGQLSVFDPARGAPCYRCIFPDAPAPHLAPSCSEAGVLGPLPGVVGAMMAVEAVKLITGAGAPMRGQMLIYDALYGETRCVRVAPRADCATCAGGTGARG